MGIMTNLLTVTNAAALAQSRGQTVSAATIKHACKGGALPAVKLGGTWAFTPAAFENWLANGRAKMGRPKKTEPAGEPK